MTLDPAEGERNASASQPEPGPAADPAEQVAGQWPAAPAVMGQPDPVPGGWIQPGQQPVVTGWGDPASSNASATKPLRARHPALRAAIWTVGLLGLAVLALGSTRLREQGGPITDSYTQGYLLGALIGALLVELLVGVGAVYLLNRARRTSGHMSLDWAWSMPIAAVVLTVSMAGSSGAASPLSPLSPGPSAASLATAPAPAVYDRIATPYTLGPTTSTDTPLIAQAQSGVGQNGISGANVVRVIGPNGSFSGYLLVIVSSSAALNPRGALAGMLDSLSQQSIAPSTTTLDGRPVYLFALGPNTSAVWLDGVFFADVIAADQTTALAIAKAVLDAQ